MLRLSRPCRSGRASKPAIWASAQVVDAAEAHQDRAVICDTARGSRSHHRTRDATSRKVERLQKYGERAVDREARASSAMAKPVLEELRRIASGDRRRAIPAEPDPLLDVVVGYMAAECGVEGVQARQVDLGSRVEAELVEGTLDQIW